MTKPIGPGTVNTALNMSREERNIWGRISHESRASLNQYIQECALEGIKLHHPALAAEIDKIRKARGMVVHIGKSAVALALIGLMTFAGSSARLAARPVRGARRQETSEMIFA